MPKKDSNFNPIGKSRGIRKQSGHVADWKSVDADRIRDAICAASNTGGALRFGYSRDGGAYAIGIYGDGDPYTEFCKPSEDIESFLADVCSLYEAIADEQATNRKAK